MKRYLSGLAALAAAFAMPAQGATINVSVTGTLLQSLGMSGPSNTGIDPYLSVGDTLTLTAAFDSSLLLPYGDGDFIVGLYGLPTTGPSFWRVDAPNITWKTTDSVQDGGFAISYDPYEASPTIIMSGDKVIGLGGAMLPAGHNPRPELNMSFGDFFKILPGNNQWFNDYNSPGFLGLWDFADSSVTDPPSADLSAVPEPATWAMFLLGFGAIGSALRRRFADTTLLMPRTPWRIYRVYR